LNEWEGTKKRGGEGEKGSADNEKKSFLFGKKRIKRKQKKGGGEMKDRGQKNNETV